MAETIYTSGYQQQQIADIQAASAARSAEINKKIEALNAQSNDRWGTNADGSTGVSDSSSPSSTVSGQSSTSGKTSDTREAPPKADAAPKTAADTVTGLCDALNKHQQELVKQGNYEVADVYEIVFSPPSLGAAKVTKAGPTESARTGMSANQTANQKLNPATNSMKKEVLTLSVTAGTQIIQFIDQVMKNSSYISDQQTVVLDKDGKETPNPANTNGQTAWYNVTLKSTPIKYDNKRRDFAYKLTYTVTPYAINNMQSQYFPKSGFRGLHKSYKYWFTGQNTEVTNFEQDFNYLYRLIISGNAPNPADQTSDSREVTRRIFQTASEQSMQGGNDKSTEPAANAADYLYSPSDQSKIKLKILGDPAWLEQGDISNNGGNTDFNFQPFLNDGTININSQQVVFDISWNKPEDYDLNTGLVPVTKKNVNGQAQIDTTYTAVKCKSTFSHGKFEQELEGVLLIEYLQNNKNDIGASMPSLFSDDGRNTTPTSTTSDSNESAAVGTGAAPPVENAPPAKPVTSNGEDADATSARITQIASQTGAAPGGVSNPDQQTQMENFKAAYNEYRTQEMARDA